MSRALIAVLLLGLSRPSLAAELFVDASTTAADGTGTAEAPFKTIAAAVKASAGGDTITVRAGTYSESVTITKSGTEAAPTVLRAAPGQRVMLSGFKSLTDWKEDAGGVFTTTVDGPVTDLFVGLARQEASRWPDGALPMRYITEPADGVFRDRDPMGDDAALKAVAESPKNAMAFIFVTKGNYYTTIPLKQLDPAGGKVTVEAVKFFNNIEGKSDRYQLINHPALVTKPGQWAFETLDDKRTKLYFKPINRDDLTRTQYRVGSATQRLVFVGAHQQTVSNVRIEGLELVGGAGDGVRVNESANVTIANCLAHHNGGTGIAVRGVKNVTIRNNLSVANSGGIALASAENVTVEMNEIAANEVDGLTVAGNISGRPGANPETTGVTVRRNYIHHHLQFAHPDNMQMYRGVKNLTIEDNLLLWGGQGIMSEEVDGATLRNSVVMGTSAIAVIFGHSNSNAWTVEQSTIGLGGWGNFSLTGKDYTIRKSVVFNGGLNAGENTTSDENLYAILTESDPMYRTPKPKAKSYKTPADVAAATGQEKQSVRVASMPFRNAPVAQAVAPWMDANGPDRLQVRAKSGALFKAGDQIEVSGDGVLRKVVSVDGDLIVFEPALPARPFRDALVWNWGEAKSPQLDLRLREDLKEVPAAGRVGANLDVAAYQRGDFDGDGKRDLPEVPEDLKANWPNPNHVVLPLFGT